MWSTRFSRAVVSKLKTLNTCVRQTMADTTGKGDQGNADRIVWVDLEMTGLDIQKEHIIEIACIVTDGNLKIVAEGPNLIIHQPDEVLNAMGEWCQKTHGETGLTDAVRKSTISIENAEETVLEFIKKHTPPKECPLAGNSIHTDRMFLVKFMPRLIDHLHYRIIDVSSIQELCKRWYPQQWNDTPKKESKHRAIDDIKESIKELEYYRQSIFLKPSNI